MTILTTTEAKTKLPAIVRKAHRFNERYVITHRGEKYGVILSNEDYEGILETIEILKNSEAIKEILQSLQEIKRGETYSFEEVVGRKQKK